MPKENPKPFIVECKYVGNIPICQKLSGHWHTFAHYPTRRARSDALRSLSKSNRFYKYRAKEDKKETKETKGN